MRTITSVATHIALALTALVAGFFYTILSIVAFLIYSVVAIAAGVMAFVAVLGAFLWSVTGSPVGLHMLTSAYIPAAVLLLICAAATLARVGKSENYAVAPYRRGTV